MYSIHAGSFLIWIVLVLAHVIGHARDLRRLAAKDWLRRSRAAVPGALVRQLAVLASLAAGLALALSLVGHVGTFQNTATPARCTTPSRCCSARSDTWGTLTRSWRAGRGGRPRRTAWVGTCNGTVSYVKAVRRVQDGR